MYIGKKQIKKISHISVMGEILERFDYNFHNEGPPDSWNSTETEIWDMLSELEGEFHKEIEKILNVNKNSRPKEGLF